MLIFSDTATFVLRSLWSPPLLLPLKQDTAFFKRMSKDKIGRVHRILGALTCVELLR